MTLKVELIRRMPWSDLKPGAVIESEFAWYLVDLGYAAPINFERHVDPVKAAHARRRLEAWYDDLRKAKEAKNQKSLRRV